MSLTDLFRQLSLLIGAPAVFLAGAGAVLIVVPRDWRAVLFGYALVNVMLSLLLSQVIPTEWALQQAIAGGLVAVMLFLSARQLRNPAAPQAGAAWPRMASLSPFRLLAVGLAGVTYAVVRDSIAFSLISPLFLDAVLWLCLIAALGLALHEAEPRAGEGNMQLFQNELMGFGIIGIKDGYSHAMPLRIRNDQPVLFKGSLSLLCVGAESGQKILAIDYLEHVITHLSSYTASYAFMDSQALERPHLDEDIADQKKRIDLTIAQLTDPNLSKAKQQEMEEQLKRQNNVLKSMQTEDWKYLISPDWLAKYHIAAPYLYFPDASPCVYTSAEGREMLQLMRRFADNEINADQFITGLDLLGK